MEAVVSNLKSTVLTPQFILAFMVAAVWCSVTISGIAAATTRRPG
jgi:hypothetical protein